MNRRGFIGFVVAAGAALLVGPAASAPAAPLPAGRRVRPRPFVVEDGIALLPADEFDFYVGDNYTRAYLPTGTYRDWQHAREHMVFVRSDRA